LEKGQKDIMTTPKFSFINGKLVKESSYIEKNYIKDKLISENILYGNDTKNALKTSHSYTFNRIITDSINISDICYDNTLDSYINGYDTTKKQIDNKVVIFIDNSKSTDTRFYKNTISDFISSIKNYNNELQDLDLYTFNSNVNKIVDTKNLEMWGYSSMNELMRSINSRNIENKRIIIITDDDNFLKNQTNNTNIKLK
jgi:hypothetical protein